MEKLQVIRKILPGVALGQDSGGNNFYIKNGDLYLGDTCEAKINEKSAVLKELDYDFALFVTEYGDRDGLIESSRLTETTRSKPYDRVFQIKDKWCFPVHSAKNLAEIVISSCLWKEARIRVSQTRFKTIAGANVFGINFNKALLKAVKEGVSKTHLYCSDNKDWSESGVFADFLIKITKTKEGSLELNSWQAIGNESILFYVHGIINNDLDSFKHIDFSYHHTTLNEIEELLRIGKNKPELTLKEKILRLDGQIQFDIAFELMSSFFPIDFLVDDFYQCVELPSPC